MRLHPVGRLILLLTLYWGGTCSVVAEQSATFKIMTEELRPLSYRENDELNGVCVELVRELLKLRGHPDNILLYPWDRAYQETATEPNRILFSVGRSEAREPLFKWVGPLLANPTYLFKRHDSNLHIESLEDARSVRSIAVRENYFAHTHLTKMGFQNLTVTRDESIDLQMLLADRTDLIAVGILGIGEYCKTLDVDCSLIANTGVKVYDSQLYLAFSRSTPDAVIDDWQRSLDQLISSPVYQQIINAYVPGSSALR